MCLSSSPRSIDSKGSIANYSMSSFLARAANCDFYSGDCDSGPDCWSFHLSHAPVLTIDSTGELLTSCSGGQSVQHWLGN